MLKLCAHLCDASHLFGVQNLHAGRSSSAKAAQISLYAQMVICSIQRSPRLGGDMYGDDIQTYRQIIHIMSSCNKWRLSATSATGNRPCYPNALFPTQLPNMQYATERRTKKDAPMVSSETAQRQSRCLCRICYTKYEIYAQHSIEA